MLYSRFSFLFLLLWHAAFAQFFSICIYSARKHYMACTHWPEVCYGQFGPLFSAASRPEEN